MDDYFVVTSRSSVAFDSPQSAPVTNGGPELADLRKYGQRVLRRFVAQARADDQPTFARIIADHLEVPLGDLPIIEERWASYEHVNVQSALDVWSNESGRTVQTVGMTNYRHRGPFGLGDLVGSGDDGDMFDHGPRPGNVSRVARATGPNGESIECIRAAILLVSEGDDRIVVLYRGSDPESESFGVTLEAMANRPDVAARTTARLRELAHQHNVYRAQVVSFGHQIFDDHLDSVLRLHPRVPLDPSALVLPEATFDDVRRQVVGVARNRQRLRASGQHLKRGLLLYGPPGVGKTHTVRYLVGELGDTTVIELSGDTLGAIKEACSIARSLQPAMIVVEDVDLIAEQRDHYGGETPLLFTLLNEMDGLDEDADVVFLLTTNRADLLEPALAARPGRVDQAVHIDLPDRDARRRLIELYRADLEVDFSRLDGVLGRTDGVTASFLKELLRRAAVVAADRDGSDDADAQVTVTADDLDHALEDLLDTRNQMTRAVLGYTEPMRDPGSA
ncbi:AAA family ATPase [Aeromicrobium sp.]|uniref:AAA family ATPase n=1 Tax=Aeromicrobium sp. TaxID=1871063 RepID=UPI003D6AB88E